ncbi:SirB2 family protein [Pelomicrobium methylotrophicum]|uniref:Regulator SirB n=1 Tax=Pelomicrobium methylotrophicum TaxID=2602750 RepID=A0A5C7EMB3_9PROT|nr:SirB2 family protein [Pelomicrobium methylotrophicum]TXF12600.1 regulator SirB [Pelomicrobium methylotrophicum]
MAYAWIKHLHVTCVAVSYALFFVRGLWMIRESPLLRRRWVRIVPHVNDTLLLATGVTLSILMHQYPLVAGWVSAKVVALVLYIFLGMYGLKHGETKRDRIVAWLAAQVVFLYIVAVAVTKRTHPAAALL